jgi:hypothetical protein
MPVLRRRWLICGIAYGVIAYFVKTWIVEPLSAAGAGRLTFALPISAILINGILIHALGVGLPIGYFTSRHAARMLAWVAVAVVCSACGSPTEPSPPPTPMTLPLASSAWQTIGQPQPYPLRNEGAALAFDFPVDGSINYLYTDSPLKAVRGTLTVTLSVTASSGAVFNSLEPQTSSCTIPPSVRPFLWANDNGDGSFDRWWSNPRAFTLAAGTATISVPLSAESWSSVSGTFGHADAASRFQFDKALLNVSRFGVTFGGGCSFGHGINVRNGTAAFTLTGYSIQ